MAEGKHQAGWALGVAGCAILCALASGQRPLLAGSPPAVGTPATSAPAVTPAPPAPPPSDPEAVAFLRRVEERHAQLASLTATFRQSFRSAATGQELEEEGRIWIKRPGHMRWDYRGADKKVFLVSPDGTTLSYVPADLTAVRDRLPEDAPQLKLLLGKGGVADDFIVTSVQLKDQVVPGSRCLKLRPVRAMPNVEMAYMEVDPQTLALGRVLVMDSLGNESDLVLSKVKENAAVKDDVFDLKLPAGVTVREAGGGSH